ncbi:MAG: succinylglutamate desuccinylase [Desulfobaccales bacterium]
MGSKLSKGLLLVAAAILCFSSVAWAGDAKLLCISKANLKGEETVNSCLTKGERFAIVDEYGLVRILQPEEVELSKAFNPKVFEQRAYGMRYEKTPE